MERGAATEGKEVSRLMKDANEDESTEKLTVKECWLSEDGQSNSPVQGSSIASGKEVIMTKLVKVVMHDMPDEDGCCDDTSDSDECSDDACLPNKGHALPKLPYNYSIKRKKSRNERQCVLPKSPQGKHEVITKSRPGRMSDGFNKVKFNKVKTFDLRGVQSSGSSKRSANFPDEDSSVKKKKLI